MLETNVLHLLVLLCSFPAVYKLWRYLYGEVLDLVPGIPIMGNPADKNFEQAVRKGDSMYPDSVYQLALPTMPEVIFPPKVMKELGSSPAGSFAAHTADVLMGKYTYQGEENLELKAGLRLLTNNLDVASKSLEAEVAFAVQQAFGDCEEWTTVEDAWAASFKIASILSSRLFLGEELSRDSEWFSSMVDYTQSLNRALGSLRPVPRIVRWLFEERLPRISSLVKARDRMEKLMQPSIRKHLERYEANKDAARSKRAPKIYEDGGELLDWVIPQYENPDPKKLTRDEVTIILEAVINMSGPLAHLFFNLAKYTEYHDPLREEYLEAIQKYGRCNKAALFAMKKMDSFMKETHRLCPPSMIAVTRKVVDPDGMQLAVGPRIPYGTLCAVSADRVNMSPEYYPDPEKFDGYRFYRMREKAVEEFKHMLVSTSDREVNFSIGIHACPGRSFWSALGKIVLAHMLTHYDLRVKPGHENEDARLLEGIRVIVNPKAILQLRRKTEKA